MRKLLLMISVGLIVIAVLIACRPTSAPGSVATMAPPNTLQPSVTLNPAGTPAPAPISGNVLGDVNAPITMDIYIDFQCPACAKFNDQTLSRIKEKYVKTGKIKIVFNHFAFIGDESTRAAEASECANDQGKFWEYADLLYANQSGENEGAFSDTNLAEFAKQLKLEMSQYTQCMTAHTHLDKVKSLIQNGTERGITSVPTFFINDQIKRGIISIEAFDALVAPLLKQ